MDEARRQVLMAEREDAIQERARLDEERARLDGFIEYVSMRLGVQVEDQQPDAALPSAPPAGQLTNDVLSLVYDQEFFGWTMPKAAAEVLRRWSPEPHHRPLKTGELMEALRKGGLTIKESRVLYRSLYTAPRLKLIKGGRWGLAQWYPPERNKTGAGRQEQLEDLVEDSGEEDNVSQLPGPAEQPIRKEVTAS
jgi:hypothetical protein